MPEITEPNSARFWRLNEIAALKAEFEGCLEPPADPEEKARRENNTERLKALTRREKAVQLRYQCAQSRTIESHPG